MTINKKILIAVLIILILVGSFVLYKYTFYNGFGTKIPLKQEIMGEGNEQRPQENNVQNQGVEVIYDQGASGKGALTVCLDECGDGVCKKMDLNCKSGDLNCVCLETPKECPQDCPDISN